ncbi:MAG: aspartate dehydrogenase [Clostridia bacterium]|nr:aspartate dehydrogenase [Clostridia bacterium]
MPFFHKKTLPRLPYDPETQEPAVRRSICTGEMTVGFVDKATGKFHDLMIVDQQGLEEFRRQAGVEEVRTIY